MLTFKAAILVKQHNPLEIVKLTHSGELQAGQVLVDINYSGICGSQIGEINGVKGPDKYLPHMLGHEGSGTVLEIGNGVKTVKKGDAVVLHWKPSKGIEAELPKYRWGDKVVNAGWVTTFAEKAIISENRLTVIPNNYDKKLAALYGCAVTTGFGVALNNAEIKIGESAAVIGAGGVGLNIVQAMHLSTANPIIAVDIYENRLELAKKHGATHIINAANEDVEAAIKRILKDRKLDVFIDNTGMPRNIKMGYEITGANGRVILVGVPKHDENITIHSLPLHFGKRLTGSSGGETLPDVDIPKYIELEKNGKLNLSDLISKTYPLENINQAIADMVNGTISGRCMIDMGN